MCGCSSNFNGMERDIVTQDEFNRGFDFTGNRPSVIEVGEDPSFDFTGNRPSVIEVGEDPSFDFMGDLDGQTGFDDFIGKKARARRQERRQLRNEPAPAPTPAPTDDTQKTIYGQGDWFNRNWVWLLVGVAVVGGGYYIYKKRK